MTLLRAAGGRSTPTPTPASVGSIQFFNEVLLDDSFDSRCIVSLPAEGVGINFAGDVTYDFWLAPSATAGDNPDSVTAGGNYSGVNGDIIIDRDLNSQFPGHIIGISAGQLYFSISTSSQARTIVGTTDMRDAVFRHCRIVRNSVSGDMGIYVAGSREAFFADGPTGSLAMPDDHAPLGTCGNTGTASCANSDPFLVLGTEKHEFQANGYIGLMAQLHISSIERSTGASYTPPSEPQASDANTLGLWDFKEQEGTTIADESGNGQTMMIVADANGPGWNAATPF